MNGSISILLTSLLLQAVALPAQEPCRKFDSLDKKVRDRKISREAARKELRDLLPALDQYSSEQCPQPASSDPQWIFPLEGYRPSQSIGGEKGSGYITGGYDYFDGKDHHAHPAHDIFIQDGNQDSLDDRTGKPVHVLSATAGIVAGVQTQWDARSDLRGGIYVIIYSPIAQDLYYYAHLRSVNVKLGECVKAGQILGEVGRTGRNAVLPRSPTHLHFERLHFVDAYPRPVDTYQDLMKASRHR